MRCYIDGDINESPDEEDTVSERSFTETLSFAVAAIGYAITFGMVILLPVLDPLFRRPQDGQGTPPLLVLTISAAGLLGTLGIWWNHWQSNRRMRELQAERSARTR